MDNKTIALELDHPAWRLEEKMKWVKSYNNYYEAPEKCNILFL